MKEIFHNKKVRIILIILALFIILQEFLYVYNGVLKLSPPIFLTNNKLYIKLFVHKFNVNNRELSGWTMLDKAVYTKNIENVKLLLEKGADPLMWNKINEEVVDCDEYCSYMVLFSKRFILETILEIVAKKTCFFHMIKYPAYKIIFSFHDKTEMYKMPNKALWIAIKDNYFNEGAKIMIDHIMKTKGEIDGDTFVYWSVDNDEVFRYIVDNYNIDVNVKVYTGKTVLFYTDIDKTKILLKKGINLNIQNNIGRTALFYSSLEKTKLLIEKGADVNIRDRDGETALFITLNDCFRANENFEEELKKMMLLIEKGADLYIKNNAGNTIEMDIESRRLESNEKKEIIKNIIEKYKDGKGEIK